MSGALELRVFEWAVFAEQALRSRAQPRRSIRLHLRWTLPCSVCVFVKCDRAAAVLFGASDAQHDAVLVCIVFVALVVQDRVVEPEHQRLLVGGASLSEDARVRFRAVASRDRDVAVAEDDKIASTKNIVLKRERKDVSNDAGRQAGYRGGSGFSTRCSSPSTHESPPRATRSRCP